MSYLRIPTALEQRRCPNKANVVVPHHAVSLLVAWYLEVVLEYYGPLSMVHQELELHVARLVSDVRRPPTAGTIGIHIPRPLPLHAVHGTDGAPFNRSLVVHCTGRDLHRLAAAA